MVIKFRRDSTGFVEYTSDDILLCDAVIIEVYSTKEAIGMGKELEERYEIKRATFYYVTRDRDCFLKTYYYIFCDKFNLPYVFVKYFIKIKTEGRSIHSILHYIRRKKIVFRILRPLIEYLCHKYSIDYKLLYPGYINPLITHLDPRLYSYVDLFEKAVSYYLKSIV